MERNERWGELSSDHNGSCISFWELEIYPEDVKKDWEILKKRIAWSFFFINIAISSIEAKGDGGRMYMGKKNIFPMLIILGNGDKIEPERGKEEIFIRINKGEPKVYFLLFLKL